MYYCIYTHPSTNNKTPWNSHHRRQLQKMFQPPTRLPGLFTTTFPTGFFSHLLIATFGSETFNFIRFPGIQPRLHLAAHVEEVPRVNPPGEPTFYTRVFPKIGVPQNGCFFWWKILLKWMIWGENHYFRKPRYWKMVRWFFFDPVTSGVEV